MKLFASKTSAKKISENSASVFHEYDLPFNKLSTGVSEINGRYPETGFDVDTEVEAVWYIVSGTGSIFVAGELYELTAGDMVMIPAGEKYWIEGKQLQLVVSSSPPWTPQQHQHREE